MSKVRRVAVADAAERLRRGGVVLHPTGGLVGLAADPCCPEALTRLRFLKDLPPAPRPFVVIGEPDMLDGLVDLTLLPKARRAAVERIIERARPGGLTFVLPASASAPEAVCCPAEGMSTIAVRCDDHPIARALVHLFGRPIVSTSANRSGAAPPSHLDEVCPEVAEAAAAVWGPPFPDGRPSTLVDLCVDAPRILREGRVSPEEVFEMFAAD